MSKTFSLVQICRTGYLDAILKLRQHKLILMALFLEVKSTNPNRNKKIAKELGNSSWTLQFYRQNMKIQSPYKSNNPKKHQMTSNDLKRPQKTSK